MSVCVGKESVGESVGAGGRVSVCVSECVGGHGPAQ